MIIMIILIIMIIMIITNCFPHWPLSVQDKKKLINTAQQEQQQEMLPRTFFFGQKRKYHFHYCVKFKQVNLYYLLSFNIHLNTFTPANWSQALRLQTNTKWFASSKWVWPYAALVLTP